ncbi:hypothetical protein [Sorangium sp. So ce1000]
MAEGDPGDVGGCAGGGAAGDDVIAVGWSRWVPEALVEGLLEGV